MTLRIPFLLTAFIATLSFPAVTHARDWSGAQLSAAVTAERSFTEDSPFGIQMFASRFIQPSTDTALAFVYVGPTVTGDAGDFSFWGAANAVGGFGVYEGSDAYGLSLWASATYLERYTLFVENDVYGGTRGEPAVRYEFYAANAELLDWNGAGLQLERFDGGGHLGPHVWFKKGPLKFDVQWFEGVMYGDQLRTLRLTSVLSF